jgi:drug/metabolite transporter (DMT)-like permease
MRSIKVEPKFAVLVLLLASVLGSLGGVFLKFAFLSFTPVATYVLNYLVASVILGIIVIAKNQYKIDKKDFSILLVALFFIAGNSLSFTIGIKYTTVIISQILYFFTPVIVMLFSALHFKQRFKFLEIVGVLLGIIGGSIIVAQSYFNTSATTQLSFGTFQGNILILLAVIFWAGYLMASKAFVRKYPPVTITAYSCLINLLVGLIFFFFELQTTTFPPQNIEPISILAILCLGIISCVFVTFLYAWSVKYTTSFIASCITFTAPISAALVSIPLLGEKVTWILLISSVIIAISFYLTSIYPQKNT